MHELVQTAVDIVGLNREQPAEASGSDGVLQPAESGRSAQHGVGGQAASRCAPGAIDLAQLVGTKTQWFLREDVLSRLERPHDLAMVVVVLTGDRHDRQTGIVDEVLSLGIPPGAGKRRGQRLELCRIAVAQRHHPAGGVRSKCSRVLLADSQTDHANSQRLHHGRSLASRASLTRTHSSQPASQAGRPRLERIASHRAKSDASSTLS